MNNILGSDICREVLSDGGKPSAKIGACASSRSCSMQCLLRPEDSSLVCIRGTRGIGKTYQLMKLGKILSGERQKAVYVNLNHFYFSSHSIYHFAEEFYRQGGRILLLDQIFKYPGWADQLVSCRAGFPKLRIAFTASSVMTLEEEYPELMKELKICDLYGFSFREYLNWHYNLSLPAVGLKQLVEKHQAIEREVRNLIDPWALLPEYLRHGYYPHQGEETLFGENLVKNMNMLLEVDLVYIRQIAPTYLPKLRKLLYLVGEQHNGVTNVSSLSEAIDTSRATVMNYLKYLADARLIRLIYREGSEYPKKPDRVYLNDNNILRVMVEEKPEQMLECKTFLLASLQDAGMEVHMGEDAGVDFVINHHLPLRCIGAQNRRRNSTQGIVNVLCGEEVRGDIADIPVWMFGLLY